VIPEIGHFALILALVLALAQAFFPIVGAAKGNAHWMAVAKPAAYGQFVFMLLAFIALSLSFAANDFSVSYVAKNSNLEMPLMFRLSAVWGSHEGSLLLWALILSAWGVAVSMFSRSLPHAVVARVLGIMGLIGIGFLLFMLLTSNPFLREFPIPANGRELNPLLQDLGLVIHPPLLYMGYVGFSVAFSFSLAALLGGHLDSAWARWSRPWTTVAWIFLTIGIALGSWWAYYELGWGGWWFWDPVENASFMPWLVGTALIHSLAVTEKRGTFKTWTVLLAITAFSLSLLGTFLVRSGVLTSVHAFATDPARGVYILIFLFIVIGGSLAIYAWRAPSVRSGTGFGFLSRETFILLNNLLLVVAMIAILLGTLYPLIIDALGQGKISVGPPYFNKVFIPLMTPLAILIGLGALTRWRQDDLPEWLRRFWIVLVASIVLGLAIVLVWYRSGGIMVALGVVLALWIVGTAMLALVKRIRQQLQSGRGSLGVPLGFYGMTLAHIGVAVFIVGITMTSNFSTQKDLRMQPEGHWTLSGYRFVFKGARDAFGPNFDAAEGVFWVYRGDKKIAVLNPQKRVYGPRGADRRRKGTDMTEAAIDPGLFRDLYVAMGEPLQGGAWGVSLYYKPFIRWVWLGAIFMALGGLFAAGDRRYRVSLRKRQATPSDATTLTSAT